MISENDASSQPHRSDMSVAIGNEIASQPHRGDMSVAL